MISLSVKFDEKTYQIDRLAFSDIVKMERHFNMGAPAALGPDMRLEHVAWLGWTAMRRLGHLSLDVGFDEFLDRVETIDVGEEGVPLDQPADQTAPPE